MQKQENKKHQGNGSSKRKAHPGPSDPSTYWEHIRQQATAHEQTTDTGCRKQLVKLIMSYSSAWCSWTLRNIYWGSITPSLMFPNIKLHPFTLQLEADKAKWKDKSLPGACITFLISGKRAQMRRTHSVFSGLDRKTATAEKPCFPPNKKQDFFTVSLFYSTLEIKCFGWKGEKVTDWTPSACFLPATEQLGNRKNLWI